MPLMMSRTRVWAPKPMATPTTLAPATSGPMSTPSAASAIITTITSSTMKSRLRKIGSRVFIRAWRRHSWLC